MENKIRISGFLLICIVFLVLTIALTYPLILKITTHMPGFFSTDEPFVIMWTSWRIKYSLINHIPLKHSALIIYPFGIDFYSGFFTYFWEGLFYLFSFFTTPVLTYNLEVLINFFLNGLFVFLLVYYMTKDKLSAIFSGTIFAFCPYQFSRAWQHLGLTFNQWIPLCLLTAFLVKENPSRRNTILFLVSILLLFSFDYVVMYLTMVSLATFLIYVLLYNWKIKLFKQRKLLNKDLGFLKNIIFAIIIAFIILLPQFLPLIKNRFTVSPSSLAYASNPYHRPFEDLFAQSARLLSYLLPAVVHPLFGRFTESFVGTPLYGLSFTEHTLYLGWIPLILAFFVFQRWRKDKKQNNLASRLRDRDKFYIGFFLFLAITAWLFSQPPWWSLGSVKIFTPSFFMYKILPMFRAYCRFGIVVMLAVAILAGYSLKFILERFSIQKVKIAVTTLFCGLVLFEFWNYPPFRVIDLSKAPEVYYWLKAQPGDFVIAEYPLDIIGPNVKYMFCQTRHEKKIINGSIPNTYANNLAKTITKLSQQKTAGVLKWMEVRYVLVHRDGYLKTDLVEDREELEKIPSNLGLKFVKSFSAQKCPQENIMCIQETGPIDVYEVITGPIEPKPIE